MLSRSSMGLINYQEALRALSSLTPSKWATSFTSSQWRAPLTTAPSSMSKTQAQVHSKRPAMCQLPSLSTPWLTLDPSPDVSKSRLSTRPKNDLTDVTSGVKASPPKTSSIIGLFNLMIERGLINCECFVAEPLKIHSQTYQPCFKQPVISCQDQ